MPDIFLIAGAPAVGKSTTARALAAQFSKSLHIPVDDLRDMVVSGLVLPGEWNEPLIEQLRLARESAANMACAYRQAGFAVVLDDFWDPHSQLTEYRQLFEAGGVHKILLYPSQQAAEERNQQRAVSSTVAEYISAGIRAVYQYLEQERPNLEQQGWLVVDTTGKSVESAVSEIIARAAQPV